MGNATIACSQGRALIADDQEPIRRSIARTLRREGWETDLVGDGPSALKAAEKRSYDLAVVDYDMPGMKGLEVLLELRAVQPNCIRLLASGDLNVDVVLDALNRGEVSRILQKPFGPDTLIATVQDAFGMRERVARQYIAVQAGELEIRRGVFADFLQSDHFKLALQPILQASSRRVVACEALMRSTHPELSSPPIILGSAEQHNMLGPLAERITQLALKKLQSLPRDIRLFVNLHPQELEDPVALGDRAHLLAEYSGQVVFEITERSDVLQVEQRQHSVQLLQDLGFQIAVDDLGAGYNSLSMLAEFTPQVIKADMSIVRDVHKHESRRRLMELIARFAETTGAELVAEGIETEAEAAVLDQMGIELYQGYLYARPTRDIDEVLAMIQACLAQAM